MHGKFKKGLPLCMTNINPAETHLIRYSLTTRTFEQLTLNQLFVLFYNALLCAYYCKQC